jgi:hypothetical protein
LPDAPRGGKEGAGPEAAMPRFVPAFSRVDDFPHSRRPPL